MGRPNEGGHACGFAAAEAMALVTADSPLCRSPARESLKGCNAHFIILIRKFFLIINKLTSEERRLGQSDELKKRSFGGWSARSNGLRKTLCRRLDLNQPSSEHTLHFSKKGLALAVGLRFVKFTQLLQ